MTDAVAYLAALAVTFAINLPCGYWRAGVRKFSPQWFVAVHAAVPMVIALRFALGLPFCWTMLPVFVAAYFGGQYAGSLLSAHHRDTRIGPHEQKSRVIGPSAHGVITRAEGPPDHHRELGYAGAGHSVYHLRPVPGDTAGLILPAHHEAGDILQEHQRHLALCTQGDEVRALHGGLAE